MNEIRQVILDTETTGLSPADGHRIIEVAAVEMINRRFTGNYLHLYINPERKIDAGAQKVHGLSEEFLQDKPKFHEIAQELFTYIEKSELIIHNAPFDLSFLNHEFELLNKNNPSSQTPPFIYPFITDCCTIIDTLVMARKKHRGQKNSLDALCHRYNISLAGREKHGALIDTKLLGEVYIAMTGGQMTLFETLTSEEHLTTEKKQLKRTFAQRSQSKSFKIIRATDMEIQAHEEY